MSSRKLWYIVTLLAFVVLPLAGCGGGGSKSATTTEKGVQLTVKGSVPTSSSKSVPKTVALTPIALNTVAVYDAQNGALLATATVAANGSFSGLSFTVATAKTVLVFKATVAAGTFLNVVPLDLSSPPAAGVITGSNPLTIVINQDTTNIASVVSTQLGLSSQLGDPGMTLDSVGKTYTDAAQLVVDNGGQILAYSGSGLALNGKLSNATLLPARDAGTLTFADMRDIALDGKIISAFIPGNQPIVNFQVVNKATGKGISGLRTFSLHVAQLKPELNGSNSYWMNYIAAGLPLSAMPAASSTPSNPSTDAVTSFNADGTIKGQGYTVIDHGDGTYTATFGANIKSNTNVPYDATLTHRIAIGARSVAVPGVVGKTPGAYAGAVNPLTGANIAQFTNTNGAGFVYDFTPATGVALTDAGGNQAFARDIINIAACNQCHYKLQFGSNNTSGHFGSRPDTKICVVCHTPQLNALYGEGDFTSFMHKIHMGEELPTTEAPFGMDLNEIKFPMDVRNCTVCHKGADVNNWKLKPSQKSCGSCHTNVVWTAHEGGQANDQFCAGCHAGVSAIKEVSAMHLPVDIPNPQSSIAVYAGAPYNGSFAAYSAAYQANGRVAPGSPNSNTNASYVAGSSLSRLPAGAKAASYVIKAVSRNASKQPVIEFKLQMATADANGVLGTPVDVVFNDPAVKSELIDGFVGGPSVYFAFAVPQDGILKPVDYNASTSGYLKRIWNGTAATVSGAAAAATISGPTAGYYTVTLTGVTIPDSAVMLTGGVGYTYGLGNAMTKVSGSYSPFATTTQPLTQIDLAAYPYTPVAGTPIGIGGLSVPADNKWKVAATYTGRRLITDNAKCNACHGRLGVKPTYHAGQRNDTQTCTFCHTVNRTNSGWAVNIKEDVHAIHGAAKRADKFSWEVSAGAKFWTVGYPGVLKNCEQCHIAGFYDFSNSSYNANFGSVFDSMLYTTVASGTMPATVNVIVTGAETVPGTYYSPYVTAGAVYGSTFGFNAGTGVTTAAAATTLVCSPISSACYACHDTKVAKAHMILNGGSIYEARATALNKRESCQVCHGGISTTNAFNETAPNIKAVHRWW